jgi:hypothetical protein
VSRLYGLCLLVSLGCLPTEAVGSARLTVGLVIAGQCLVSSAPAPPICSSGADYRVGSALATVSVVPAMPGQLTGSANREQEWRDGAGSGSSISSGSPPPVASSLRSGADGDNLRSRQQLQAMRVTYAF